MFYSQNSSQDIIINRINDKLRFGKYKNIKISQVLVENPNYISWCIRYLDDFYIDSSFIKEAVMVNNKFNLGLLTIEILEKKINKVNEYYAGFSFGNIKTMSNETESSTVIELRKFSYKDWLNPALQSKLIELEYKRRREEEEKRIELEEVRRQYKIEDEERRYRDETNWSSYNEDLGWGEQSEEFWNQF